MKKASIMRLAASIILCLAAGFIGSYFTAQNIPTWYQTLEKPSFNPPNWVFAPVWTTLYIMMGISLYLIWESDPGFGGTRQQLTLFLAQLILNTLWSIVFFGMKQIALALAVILLLWVLILATIIYFNKISKTAAVLLIPYLLWVSFATLLNYSIMSLNP